MIRVRMKDDPSKHKCLTCSHGRVTSLASGETTTACSFNYESAVGIWGVVTECSKYSFRYKHTPGWADDKGWILEVKKGRIIGFKPPED